MAIKGCSKEDRLFTGFRIQLNREYFASELKWDLDKINNVLKSLIKKGDIEISLNNEIKIYFFPPVKNAKEYREVLEGTRVVDYDNSEDELEFLRLMYFCGISA
jgi:hypothetical protein